MVEKMSVLHSSSPFCAHSTKQKAKYFCLLGSRFERRKTMRGKAEISRCATFLFGAHHFVRRNNFALLQF